MREILFQGKRLDSGAWCFGGVYAPESVRPCIVTRDRTGYLDHVEVDPTTIGQYTGCKDRTGTRIFEGDVILHYNRPGDKTAHVTGVVFWDEEACAFRKKNLFNGITFDLSPACDYEVIGNIYDNPELIGGAK